METRNRFKNFIQSLSGTMLISEYFDPKELAIFALVCKKIYVRINTSEHILKFVNPYKFVEINELKDFG